MDSLPVQRVLRRISPVQFHYPEYKLANREMYYQEALLNTIDGTTDYYKHRRKPGEIRRALEALGAVDIAVDVGGNGIEAYARKVA